MNSFSVFSYKTGSSFIYRIPSWIKILFVPALNIGLFLLNWKISAAFILLQIILFTFLGFSAAEQFTDLKPVFIYSIFLYIMNLFMQFYALYGKIDLPLKALIKVIFINTFTDSDTAVFCIKFCACVQSCSLMFKTTSSIEIKSGIETIEKVIRKCIPFAKKEPLFSLAFSMLINFIPTVFKIWHQLERAWIARNGKKSPRMILALTPQLFSLGLKYSYDITRALINRGQKTGSD